MKLFFSLSLSLVMMLTLVSCGSTEKLEEGKMLGVLVAIDDLKFVNPFGFDSVFTSSEFPIDEEYGCNDGGKVTEIGTGSHINRPDGGFEQTENTRFSFNSCRTKNTEKCDFLIDVTLDGTVDYTREHLASPADGHVDKETVKGTLTVTLKSPAEITYSCNVDIRYENNEGEESVSGTLCGWTAEQIEDIMISEAEMCEAINNIEETEE